MTDAPPAGTRICSECGATTPADEDFCVQCGAYLGWDSTSAIPVQSPAPPVPAVPPVDAPATPAVTPPATPAATPAVPPITPADPRPPGAGSPARAATPSTPAGQGVPPGRAPSHAAPPPTTGELRRDSVPPPVRPAERVIPAPIAAPTPAKPAIAPGDIICPACGTGNNPSRHYCVRCAADLSGGAVAAGAVPPAQPPAGSRPPREGPRFRLRWFIVVVVVLAIALAAYFGRAWIGGIYNGVVDKVAGTAVLPTKNVSASSERPLHPVHDLIDTDPTTWWAPSATGPGIGEQITVEFDHPVRIVSLQVRTGASVDLAAFNKRGRPIQFDLELTRSDNTTTGPMKLTLSDKNDNQQALYNQQPLLGQDNVTSARLTVTKSAGASDRWRIGIVELEFLGR